MQIPLKVEAESTNRNIMDNHSVVTMNVKTEAVDVERTVSLTSKRHDYKRIDVRKITYDSPEKKATWWQRLSAFQMPWEWAQDLAEQNKYRILNEVSFSVNSGQMLAVLGSSGN